jgi:hypothetical protein
VQAVIADMTPPARFGLDGDGGIRHGLHPFGCWLSVCITPTLVFFLQPILLSSRRFCFQRMDALVFMFMAFIIFEVEKNHNNLYNLAV